MPAPRELVEKLNARAGTLSGAKGRIARYLVAEWGKAAFMTAAQIGDASGSSGTVVIRLAYELGYQGFPSLQRELQAAVHEELSGAGRLRRSAEIADPVAESFARNAESLRQISAANPTATFDRLAEMILSARSICVMGTRSGHAPALVLGHELICLRNSVYVVPEPAIDWYDVLRFFTPDDLLLTVCFTRYWRATIEAMNYARERSVPVATITDLAVSPAAQAADLTLLTTTDSASFALSYTGCSILIDALLAAVGKKFKPENSRALAELETIYRKTSPFYGTTGTETDGSEDLGDKGEKGVLLDVGRRFRVKRE